MECCLTVSKLGHANNTHITCLCDADILEELLFHTDSCFLKGKRKEEELIQCIKFTGVIMTFLSLPDKRACFLVMWQKSAQVIYNTVVWIKALIWIETDVLSIKDTSVKQTNVSAQWNLVVTNVSLSQTFRIFCTASDVCVGSWCVSVSSACLWLGETNLQTPGTQNIKHIDK